MAKQQTLNREEIARRAYEIFLKRGGKHGSPMSDWLQAEAELRSGNGGNGGAKAVSASKKASDQVVVDAPAIKPARGRARNSVSARK